MASDCAWFKACTSPSCEICKRESKREKTSLGQAALQRLAEEAVAHIQSAGCTTQKKSVIGASVLTTVYGLRFVYFAVIWASANPRDAYMERRAACVGGPRQGFPCLLLPGLLSNWGPQPRSCFAPRTFSRDFRLTMTVLSYETEVGILNQGFPGSKPSPARVSNLLSSRFPPA